jgi:protein-S-isoprenylcysteine O-methyltransferase Ste14
MELLRKIGALTYGVICYAIFVVTFLYLIGFLANGGVPKTIDSGVMGPVGLALIIDTALCVLFGLQHTVMARPGFKRVFTRLVPASIERSTYLLASSVALILLYWQWRPLPTKLYELDGSLAFWTISALYLLGYGFLLYATFLIDHFDLFGLRQVFMRAIGRPYTEKRFATPGLYKLVRHPIYIGWIMAFWAAPTMSVGRLLFATVMTAYILVAIPFEERDLVAALGEPYRRWRASTPAFIPRFGRSPRTQAPRVGQQEG